MILCIVEHDSGRLEDQSAEALTMARGMAGAAGVPLHAVIFGPGGDAVAAAIGEYGVSVLHLADSDALASYAPVAWARGVIAVVEAAPAEAVVASGTDRGNEVMATVGALAGLPMVANCIDVQPGDPYRLSRLRWAGSVVEDAELDSDGPRLFSVAPGSVVPAKADSAVTVETQPVPLSLSDADLAVRVLEHMVPEHDGASLVDSRVVVGGGRGVGSAEGFAVLDELAGLLGGAVGVSRAVTSLGWRPHRDQIGQTGVRIAPDLYIACGISGAIQHMVGCKSARRILAINSDADAPIMSKADYAVAGDLHVVLPALVDELRRITA